MIRRRRFLFGALGAIRCASAAQSQGRPAAEALGQLARDLEELRAELRIPGMSAAVVAAGKVVWSRGYGHADLEGTAAATPDTRYEIASLTKTFASTLLLELVQEHRLDLDEPIAKYTERVPGSGISVRHVFTHTSSGTPGERYRYDGARFAALTDVLEKVSGKTFRDLLAARILDPLGMFASVPGHDVVAQRARWGPILGDLRIERYAASLRQLARPYRLHGAEVVPALYPPRGISASAGLLSTVLDLAKYDAAVDANRFLRAETQALAWTPAVSTRGGALPYALGWFVQTHRDIRLVWHYGYWPDSFSALIVKAPERKLTFILLANSDGLSAPFDNLGAGDCVGSAFACAFLRRLVFQGPDDCEGHGRRRAAEWLDERRRSAPPLLAIDTSVYAEYAGRYELAPDRTLRITRDGDRLVADTGENEPFEIFPETVNRFFAKASSMRFTFQRDGGRGVVSVRVERLGRTSEFRKAP